jgi:hypothetical protein
MFWNVVFWGCVLLVFCVSRAHGVLAFIGFVAAIVGLVAVGVVKSTDHVRDGKQRRKE